MTYFELASNLRLSCNWIETDLERICVCFLCNLEPTWGKLGTSYPTKPILKHRRCITWTNPQSKSLLYGRAIS